MATDTPRGFVHWFDDFLGDLVPDQVSSATENSGTNAISVLENGVLRLTTGATSGNRTAVTLDLNWQADNAGPLWMEARIKSVTAITTRAYFVGFTDVIASGTLENPIEQSGTTITATATDAVGFMYDTDSTTDVWYMVGVKAGAATTATSTAQAPAAAATYETLRVMVDTDGKGYFYINGKLMGTVANAVSTGVSLTPVVMIETRDASALSLDLDYLEVKGARV